MRVLKISFIIPCYNDHNFLDEAIESILQHTSGLFEILIIDDGSPTPIATPFDKYPNVKVLKLPTNQGVSAARNLGIQSASGDYIVFCDSDDFITGDVSFLMEEILERHQSADLIFGQMENEQNTGVNKPLTSDVFTDDISKRVRLISFTRFLYARKFLLSKTIQFKIGLSNCEDTLFIMNCAAMADKIVRSNYVFYHYRTRLGSAARSLLSDKKISDRFALIDGIIDLLKDQHSKAYILKMLQTFMWDMNVLHRVKLHLSEDSVTTYLTKLSTVYQDCFAFADRPKFCNQNGLPWTGFHETCMNLLSEADYQRLFATLHEYFSKEDI